MVLLIQFQAARVILTNNFSLDAQLSYNYVNLEQKDTDYYEKNSGIGFRIGFSVFLGK